MEIIHQLKLAGFANDDISALTADKTGLRDFGYERHTKAPEGALVGGLIGALLGATFGWLAWLGVVPLPVLAPLIASGVSLSTVAGAAFGALSGGLVGSLLGLAQPEYEARRYVGKVPGDNILMCVHCQNGRAVRWARHIFQSAGASDIATGAESLTAPRLQEPSPAAAPSA